MTLVSAPTTRRQKYTDLAIPLATRTHMRGLTIARTTHSRVPSIAWYETSKERRRGPAPASAVTAFQAYFYMPMHCLQSSALGSPPLGADLQGRVASLSPLNMFASPPEPRSVDSRPGFGSVHTYSRIPQHGGAPPGKLSLSLTKREEPWRSVGIHDDACRLVQFR